MRGILQAGRPAHESRELDEDSSEDQEEVVREREAASEDEKELEPEKEKNPQVQDKEAKLDYCSMEAIAERWRDKPRKQEVASASPEVRDEVEVRPMASVSGIKGKKNPTLLLAELLQIEGEMAVMQYDTGGHPHALTLHQVAKRKCTFWTVPGGGEDPKAAMTSG